MNKTTWKAVNAGYYPFAPGVIERDQTHDSRRRKVLTALLCCAVLAITCAVVGFSLGYFKVLP